ncbi:hypothetical protein CY35_16G068900 [Sphagnum magellanicum]|nr:hypothetical protein CY35_16G068900 [Sphagnum magellanicum]
MKHAIVLLLALLMVLIISCSEVPVSYKLDPSYYSSSCADVLPVVKNVSGGPFWNVELGRQAGTTASKAAADNSIPTQLANVLQLVSKFNAVGLSEQDVVVLAGAHTIGKARCTSFQAQLHDQNGKGQLDPSLETSCLHKLQHLSPAQNGDSNQTTNLDLCTPTSFDNQYYKNLQAQNGLLFPDEVLFTTPGDSHSLINLYANSQETFFNYFTTSMLKMGRTKVLTGNEGQVHTNCRIVNVEH